MTDDLKEQLLPCPFCGATPVLDYHDGDVISCRCGAVMEGRSTEAVIAAWNTRAPDPRIAELETRLAAAEAGESALAKAGSEARIALAGMVRPDNAINLLDAALAAYEARRKG